MHRHGGHLHRRAGGVAARGERDVEEAGAFLGVVVEELVEVAHPVEHQDVGMLALDAEILLHHGGVIDRLVHAADFNGEANAMLTVHHLGRSQSERIVWLCEELGLDYELKRYERDPASRLAPPEYKALHPIGTAPVITDGDLVLGESGAIIEYIIAKYGAGRLARQAGHPEFVNYLYWFHYANASFQALLHRTLVARRLEPPPDHPALLDLP